MVQLVQRSVASKQVERDTELCLCYTIDSLIHFPPYKYWFGRLQEFSLQ